MNARSSLKEQRGVADLMGVEVLGAAGLGKAAARCWRVPGYAILCAEEGDS